MSSSCRPPSARRATRGASFRKVPRPTMVDDSSMNEQHHPEAGTLMMTPLREQTGSRKRKHNEIMQIEQRRGDLKDELQRRTLEFRKKVQTRARRPKWNIKRSESEQQLLLGALGGENEPPSLQPLPPSPPLINDAIDVDDGGADVAPAPKRLRATPTAGSPNSVRASPRSARGSPLNVKRQGVLRAQLDEAIQRAERAEQALNDYKKESEESRSKLMDELAAAKAEVTRLRAAVDVAEKRVCEMQASHEKALRDLQAQVERLIKEKATAMEDRRLLHNELQETKGAIRVLCRVRPSSKSASDTKAPKFSFPSADTIEIGTVRESAVGGSSSVRTTSFTFNRVFDEKSTQAQVFAELSGLVQSALDGFDVCIFAYGQTGTGKTYTMEGPEGVKLGADDARCGIVPRTVSSLFTRAEQARQLGWTYAFHCSILEIYVATVYDLLSKSRQALEIRQNSKKEAVVTNLSSHPCENADDVYALMRMASQARRVSSTDKNDRSSRSHCVFRLCVSGRNADTKEEINGILNLIDLAGSERLAASGATGDQLKEAQCINSSLSTLGDVISALGARASHVPYRNSKLTRLLEPSLSRGGKCLMVCNVSMEASDLNETLNTLRFAEKVNQCVTTKKK